MNSSSEIRRTFLEFFRARGHEVVASSSLVPHNDPSLLFTNAGMVQFKDAFLGLEQRPVRRAASSQRCVRAGGKHNDLENVGYTARHHTFFEMLGNFSFGDYFKRDAIRYAWEFLTEVAGLPAERLWVTVFEEDGEAERIWLEEVGVPAGRLRRIGGKDNFWSMGDTGPCGPCSEIFYDHGPEVAGGPPGSADEDGDRYIEIWNLVFMQYDRAADGTLQPLPAPSVDTGMGLERLAAVLQGVHDNYDIDLFRALVEAAATLLGVDDRSDRSLRVIADHLRSCSFLVVDGVVPGNEGRGYVLRRILRRAIRHGARLGADGPFMHRLVAVLVEQMGEAYPELAAGREHVEQVLRHEEERFAQTLEQGMALLDEALANLSGDELPGETVFRLYDTYGFPPDLTADVARERGVHIDQAGFDAAMQAQRERARDSQRFAARGGLRLAVDNATAFEGYDRLRHDARIAALYRGEEAVEQLAAGEDGLVVLDATPFYGESGGQVGDTGRLHAQTGVFVVNDTQKYPGEVIGHHGRVESGTLSVGESLAAEVDAGRRAATALNHSATHLLHAALRAVLGDHVAQKGSLVTPDRLRFDFSHASALGAAELARVEDLVNEQVRANHAVDVETMALETALERGAAALFGEKYGARVRVLSMGDFSVELCGGTHVARTGDIGLFRIVAEAGVAAGVRRIEAVTGTAALALVRERDTALSEAAQLLQCDLGEVPERLSALQRLEREQSRQLQQIKSRLASQAGDELLERAETVGDIKVLAAEIEQAYAKALRETLDRLRNRLGECAVVLASRDGGKVSLVAGVTASLKDSLPAGKLVNQVAAQVGGKGGGRPDMAMAGGNQPEQLPAALNGVVPWVREQLAT